MDRLYFRCHVRLNGADAFVVWYTNDRCGFVRSPGGQLLVAESGDALTVQTAAMGVSVQPEAPTDYDFGRIRAWCHRPTAEGMQCDAFLNAWNFLDDLAGLHDAPGTEYAQLSRAAAGCYDKLFWGNNLPSVTPPGKRFDPSWSPEELVAIRRVFEAGLRVLQAELAGSGSDA